MTDLHAKVNLPKGPFATVFPNLRPSITPCEALNSENNADRAWQGRND